MEKAVIYARQSSGSDDYSESVAVQIRNCRHLAEHSKIKVVAVFQDLNVSGKTYPEGWETLAASDHAFQSWFAMQTGSKSSRKGLGELFRTLAGVNYIIVDDITRLYRPLSRSFLEAAVNQYLIEHGVRILQVKGGMLDLNQFDQQLITMLKNQINDEQIAKQRQRSIEVLNRLRDSGFMPTGVTAWGLRYLPVRKRISADPAKLPVIRYLFDRVDAGDSYNRIVHEVNARWGHLFRTCFWEKSLYQITSRPIYAGYQYNTAGELIKNRQWDGVVSLEQFQRVQAIMAKRREEGEFRKGRGHHWMPLSGLLVCGVCGSRLVSCVDDGRVAYRCKRGYFRGDNSCYSTRIMVDYDKPKLVGLLRLVRQVLPLGLAGASEAERGLFLGELRKRKMAQEVFETLLMRALVRIEVYGNFVRMVPRREGVVLPDVPRFKLGRYTGFARSELARLRRHVRALTAGAEGAEKSRASA